MIILSRYRIKEEIYADGGKVVYRGEDELEQKPVIVKTLSSEYPTIQEITDLRQEFTILQNLNLKGIVKTYSLEKYQNGLALILEDFGGQSLKQLLCSQTIPLDQFLQIAIALAETLAELHQVPIIHKDINPSNIIINPETGQIKITSFSIASRLLQENPSISNSYWLEGTLAYISPEQTGKMNRVVDYRSDLYSLGCTFYEMLTGKLPFMTTEPMELIHSHLAKQPLPPHQLIPEIHLTVSFIVMKLLAKNAEDRYQSASGLKFDLENCLEQLQATGQIINFKLAQHDRINQLLLPQKLYGREVEVAALIDTFERVRLGAAEIMLVSGYSGIGKTVVVNEIHKPVVAGQGYFIAGKFDQFKRNIPYSALIQAFGSLIRQLLTESSQKIAIWKEKLLNALGVNSQLIIDVIPEVELLIGKQPEVASLGLSESQHRFEWVFQRFIHIFCQKEHPLVLFLDDLHCADSASLKLIQILLADSHRQYLLIIGVYRDNEVSPTHPLIETIKKIEETGAGINQIAIEPLKIKHVSQLVAETLNESEQTERLNQLVKLLFSKTQGNPFFLRTLLKTLYSEKLLIYDLSSGNWQWDIQEIQAVGITDYKIIELVARNIDRLAETTQQLLKLAACLGNQFNLEALAIANEQSTFITAAQLWEALQEGLILPLSNNYRVPMLFGDEEATRVSDVKVNYKFLHDRVQQAAYYLIPESEKKATHLKIGQLLLQNTSVEQRRENIFALVNQLNFGTDLLATQTEKDELAELNLSAAQQAKERMAFASALKYLNVGLGLLASDSWSHDYDLTLALYMEAIEAEYLNSNFEQSRVLSELTLDQTKTLLEKVKVYELQIQTDIAQNQMQAAIDTGLQVLGMLGISLAQEPPRKLNVRDLADLPEITDPNKIEALRILNAIGSAAVIANPSLLLPIGYTEINLCIKYGNSPSAVLPYINYALLLCGLLGDIDYGYQLAQLSLKLMARFNATKLKSKILNTFNAHVRHWKEHARYTLEPLREAFQSRFDTGDLEYAGYAIVHYCSNIFFLGDSLQSVEQEQTEYLDVLKSDRLEYHVCYAQIGRQITLNLLGHAEDNHRLIGEAFNQQEMLPVLINAQNGTSLFYAYLGKLLLLYLFKKPEMAIANAREAEKYQQSVPGFLLIAEHNFYYSLALLAHYSAAKQQEQSELLSQVAANQEKMENWANHAPSNFQHKYDLVEAEKARVLGENWSAMELYDRAIQEAAAQEYIQVEALAHELAAEFYLSFGREKVAQTYLVDAYYGYVRWGAKAKVRDFEERYPQLLARINTNVKNTTVTDLPTTLTTRLSLAELDCLTLLKTSQAISEEIVLDKLLKKLMEILMENTGAQKGLFLLPFETEFGIESEGNSLIVAAEGVFKEETKIDLPFVPVNQDVDLPVSVINYVQRTREALVLNQASQEGMFTKDPYVVANKVQSIFALPVIYQGKLNAIVYLENRLATRSFAQERVEVLKVLVSQISISLENAHLYRNLEHQAFYDLLTDLPNRKFFEEQLATAIANARRYQKMMAIIFIDLDRFKTVNDTLGHTIGDQLLQVFAQKLNSCLREGDSLARWGGDEFTLLLPQIHGAEDAAKISQRIIDALQHPFAIENHELHVQTSIGIALYPQDGEDVETLLSKADAALYRAKQKGRNQYQFYLPTMNTGELLRLENLLHRALKRKEFLLYYQPLINIKTGRLCGLEALVRWHHPELGIVSPQTFISLAEETGLILPLGEWVLETACAQNKAWQLAGLPWLKVAVNLSPRQFQQKNLVAIVEKILDETGLDCRWLELEITESSIMQNMSFARKALQDLYEMGVHISMDDFGTGYSSLGYLKKLPFHTLKIDKSFVEELKHNPQDVAIISAVIALGRGLDLQVVAEGIETQMQVDILRNLGCELMQGYFFSRPLTAQDAVQLYQIQLEDYTQGK